MDEPSNVRVLSLDKLKGFELIICIYSYLSVSNLNNP
jgi:hypothetical protein